MRSLERITFLVALACMFMSAGEVLAGPTPTPIEYVMCEVSEDGAACTTATAGKACAKNKTCSLNASNPCVCI